MGTAKALVVPSYTLVLVVAVTFKVAAAMVAEEVAVVLLRV